MNLDEDVWDQTIINDVIPNVDKLINLPDCVNKNRGGTVRSLSTLKAFTDIAMP